MRYLRLSLTTLLLLLASGLRADAPFVVVLRVEGMINPIIGDYIKDGIDQALKANAPAVLIELDTPGGLLDTTRDIVQSMLNAELPIIVYVTPQGARATSAGVFIMMAADVAAMAPGTHLGAAHPVTIGGDAPSLPSGKDKKSGRKETGSVMNEKMTSDAAAYIRSIATDKGRNAAWAEKAVRESVSLTSDEALKEKVVDLIAASRADLLKAADGKTLQKKGRSFVLKLAGAAIQEFPMSQFRKWLQMLAHPNVAYILMTLGVYGLIYELASPGIGLGGAVGGICLLLAFFSLQVLPINTVGLALIALGVVLLALELFAPSHGLLTFGGLIAFALGSFFLIDVKQNPAIGRISIELIASTVGATALFFGVALKKTLAAKRSQPKTGAESLIGMTGVVQSELNPEGTVDLNGELWTAQADAAVEAGAKVTVVRVKGNKLFVK